MNVYQVLLRNDNLDRHIYLKTPAFSLTVPSAKDTSLDGLEPVIGYNHKLVHDAGFFESYFY